MAPPPPSLKGTGKKANRSTDHARRSRSRNTTPAVVIDEVGVLPSHTLELSIPNLSGASYDSIVSPGSAPSASTSNGGGGGHSLSSSMTPTMLGLLPDSRSLESVMERIQTLIDQIAVRDEAANKALRKIMEIKRGREEEEREEVVRERERERVKIRERERDREEEEERMKKANKKRKAEGEGKVKDGSGGSKAGGGGADRHGDPPGADNHQKLDKFGSPKVACPDCGKTFTKATLRDHMGQPQYCSDEKKAKWMAESAARNRSRRSTIVSAPPATLTVPQTKKRKASGQAAQDHPLAQVRAAEVNPPAQVTAAEARPLARVRAASVHPLAQVRAAPLPPKSKASSSGAPRAASVSSSLTDPTDVMTPSAAHPVNDEDSSSDSEPEPPIVKMPEQRIFGDNPLTFNDPTRYHVPKVNLKTDRPEVIREAAGVSVYPPNDLRDLIPGDPPDSDFSNPKPTSQVQASTFATYVEPYLRSFNEEDEAFLRSRGDRITPYTIPPYGPKSYRQIWDEEDGIVHVPVNKRNAHEGRGGIENLNDQSAENDESSLGAVASRLMSAYRVESRAPVVDQTPVADVTMMDDITAEDDMNLQMMGADETEEPSQYINNAPPAPAASKPGPLPAATYMAESNTEMWKRGPGPKLSHDQVDSRIVQELTYLGFVKPNEQPRHDEGMDTWTAQKLRELQALLKEIEIKNGGSKRLLLDQVQEERAMEEYKSIHEDVGTQINSAYAKSTRTMSKSSKKKSSRPAASGAASTSTAGVARPGVRDQTKMLMDRRTQWATTVGPAFADDPQLGRVPKEPVLTPEALAPYIEKETEQWYEDRGEAMED